MDEQKDGFHRAITGQAVTRGQIITGSIFVVAWFLMDFVQWIDWLWGKL